MDVARPGALALTLARDRDRAFLFRDLATLRTDVTLFASVDALEETVLPGGVFIGVGPEQHFAHVAATQPAFAVIVDIRRQNLVQHRTYTALFERSSDRADFQSRL